MVFCSKKDKFFITIMSSSLVVITVVFLVPLYLHKERTLPETIMVLALFILSVGFILWISMSIKYVFLEEHLLVKGGPIRSKIPFKEITKVSPTKDILTGYRLSSSIDGLEIFYKSALLGSVKISPKEKEEFITQLKKRNETIRITS
ncbi:PH domain-containing protein [Neobacillus niacini]|uniref:PH domain-containing protein n=1 Tax=Neobacillus niacini TaxID=86668 RepID=UPI0030009011